VVPRRRGKHFDLALKICGVVLEQGVGRRKNFSLSFDAFGRGCFHWIMKTNKTWVKIAENQQIRSVSFGR
jgi:hypothetical protein